MTFYDEAVLGCRKKDQCQVFWVITEYLIRTPSYTVLETIGNVVNFSDNAPSRVGTKTHRGWSAKPL